MKVPPCCAYARFVCLLYQIYISNALEYTLFSEYMFLSFIIAYNVIIKVSNLLNIILHRFTLLS